MYLVFVYFVYKFRVGVSDIHASRNTEISKSVQGLLYVFSSI